MLCNPCPGQLCRIHYAARRWGPYGIQLLPHQDRCCMILLASKGKPRNHLVEVADGSQIVVPCGNLVRWEESHD